MFDRTDQSLQEWAKTVVGKAEVSLQAPGELTGPPRVSLYLLALAEGNAASADRFDPAPLRIQARYLISVSGEPIAEAHRLLGELVFAAQGHAGMTVDLTPVSDGMWRAFGVAPRPALLVQVPVEMARPRQRPPLVRDITVRAAPLRRVRGMVVGPGDVALAGALVELPALGLRTRTDARGRFTFAALPAEPKVQTVLLRARGKEQECPLTTDSAAGDGEQWLLRFDGLES